MKKFFKNINEWLNEHYFLWEEENREGVVRLWAFFITVILFVFLGITRLTGLDTMIQIWAGLVTFASPVIAGLVALFKREKWNPWYWFPILKGGVSGGLIAMLIVYLCRNLFGC
jgi:hypothetical protein